MHFAISEILADEPLEIKLKRSTFFDNLFGTFLSQMCSKSLQGHFIFQIAYFAFQDFISKLHDREKGICMKN